MDAATPRASIAVVLAAIVAGVVHRATPEAPPVPPVAVAVAVAHAPPPPDVRWIDDLITIPQVNARWAVELHLRFDGSCEPGNRSRIFVMFGPDDRTTYVDNTRPAAHAIRVEANGKKVALSVDGRVVARGVQPFDHALHAGIECGDGRFPTDATVTVDRLAYEVERVPCNRCQRAGAGWSCGGIEETAPACSPFANHRFELVVDGTATGLALAPDVTALQSGLTRITVHPATTVPLSVSFTMSFTGFVVMGDFMVDEDPAH